MRVAMMRRKMTSRQFVTFPIKDFLIVKQQMLSWASRFNIFCFLDDHGYSEKLQGGGNEHAGAGAHAFECLLAVGAVDFVEASAGDAFARLREFADLHADWLFGHFSYELVRETEGGEGAMEDPIGFPDLYFFVPEIVIELGKDFIRIGSDARGRDQETIFREIGGAELAGPGGRRKIPVFQSRFTPEAYMETVETLRRHIRRGDCYEINFCQEFYSQPARIDPLATWRSLSKASPNPFAAFYRLGERWLFCASPERYLKKTGNTIMSQPIKGTAPRVPGNPEADEANRQRLYLSSKDRSENVMVVDLVRNDLSKVCLPDTVSVEELYGIYSFPQVHQMISTVKGELAPGKDWVDAVKASFPMGSMTGAPKKKVTELIGRYERSKRGLFSGAVGYVSPERDMDLNVVIRSLLYNREREYLQYQVGSGITFYSEPQAEYEECLVKAEGIRKALEE
jgi:para-aminobenzoate synthetase component 1